MTNKIINLLKQQLAMTSKLKFGKEFLAPSPTSGIKVELVAEIQAFSNPIINNWIDRWHESEVKSLDNKPMREIPLKADDEYSPDFVDATDKELKTFGYEFGFITL